MLPVYILHLCFLCVQVVLSSPLDYETASSQRVTITCKDQGTPSLANTTSFTVQVRDANDNAPVFDRQTYAASVLENQPGVLSLLTVSQTCLYFINGNVNLR